MGLPLVEAFRIGLVFKPSIIRVYIQQIHRLYSNPGVVSPW